MNSGNGILVGLSALESRALTAATDLNNSAGELGVDTAKQPILHWRQWWLVPPTLVVWALAWQMATDNPELAELAGSADLRANYARSLSELSGEAALLLPGLALGYTDGIPIELVGAMRESGLSHLTAVSGANCVIPVVLGAVLGRWLHLGWRWRIILQLALLAGFIWMVWPQATILRAGIMLAVVLLTKLSGRGPSALPVLSLTVLGILVWQPELSHDLSFALSVLATFGVVAIAPGLTSWLGQRIFGWIAEAAAVTIAAVLMCSPLLIMLDARLSGSMILANLVAGPAALIGSALGTLAAATLWWPSLSTAISASALPAAWVVELTARWWAEHQIAVIGWPQGEIGSLAAIAVLVAIVLSLVCRRALAHILRVVAALVAAVAITCQLVAEVAQGAAIPSTWQLVMCDVGQGDAMLIRAGKSIAMSDTGPTPAAAKDCLVQLGIKQLDLVVISHFDADHVGGLSGVLDQARVAAVLVPEAVDNRPGAVAARALIRKHGIPIYTVSQGMTGSMGEGATSARWQAWWPRPATPASATAESGVTSKSESESESNANALVLNWELPGGCTLAALADTGREQQLAMLGHAARVNIVKVAHHGSSDFAQTLNTKLHPQLALIGVGANSYGHPTADALLSWRSLGATVGRTDQDGAIATTCSNGQTKIYR